MTPRTLLRNVLCTTFSVASLSALIACAGGEDGGRFDTQTGGLGDGGSSRNCSGSLSDDPDDSDDEDSGALTPSDGGRVLRQAKLDGGADAGDDEEEDIPSSGFGNDDDDDGCTASTSDAGRGGGTVLDVPDEPEETEGASCGFTNRCNNAADLGSIAGDDRAESKTREGTTSQWVKIRVNEVVSGFPNLLAKGMKVRATLTVPAATNFDLFMYMSDNSLSPSCTNVRFKSEKGTGASETVAHTWGELGATADSIANDSVILFEIRHITGECGANKKWKLTVNGNID